MPRMRVPPAAARSTPTGERPPAAAQRPARDVRGEAGEIAPAVQSQVPSERARVERPTRGRVALADAFERYRAHVAADDLAPRTRARGAAGVGAGALLRDEVIAARHERREVHGRTGRVAPPPHHRGLLDPDESR